MASSSRPRVKVCPWHARIMVVFSTCEVLASPMRGVGSNPSPPSVVASEPLFSSKRPLASAATSACTRSNVTPSKRGNASTRRNGTKPSGVRQFPSPALWAPCLSTFRVQGSGLR
eukprot:CAMPEP_0198685132 /NCGR_PEP_ID=MMETSP1468-20131203/13219_1 /TAXON_ID=1461545 /ORGANISM="Mantoniella sp, Strain CCMP1436" /LENGTH=114 /DNA_ID=CAMNT_0044430423 /DNA_START=41 /DNA_END=382 /DNA_ORIENTATION=+